MKGKHVNNAPKTLGVNGRTGLTYSWSASWRALGLVVSKVDHPQNGWKYFVYSSAREGQS